MDTITASSTLPGQIWSFTTGTFPNAILVDFGEGGSQALNGGELIGPTAANSSNWNGTSGVTGSLGSLKDSSGATTRASVIWTSSNTWRNGDSTINDEGRMAKGYLDDGTTSGGKGARVTLNNIPYSSYRVHGLFASNQNSGGSVTMRNFDVNGTWALGGDSSTTTAAWGSISANSTNNGAAWTRIVPGSVQGNYWVVKSSGATCNIIGERRTIFSSNRASLTAVIIEDASTPINHPPVWASDPISKPSGDDGSPYSSSLASDAIDPNAGDTLTFSKVSGPAWLNVATNGVLTGTPTAGDQGLNQWTIRATDNSGLTSDTTLDIVIGNILGTLFSDDFERTPGDLIGNGWLEPSGSSRIFPQGGGATSLVISNSSGAGTPFVIVNQLTDTYVDGLNYEIEWNATRAGAASRTLVYDVSIGTWDGTTFTPLASQSGSITGVNGNGKIAGPTVSTTATGAVHGQQIAIRFEVVTNSGDWVGFDDVAVNALEPITAPTGFSAVAGDAQVQLNWNVHPNATAYAVRRAASSGGPYTLLDGNVLTNSYTDNAVTNGTTYYYTVSSIDTAEESDPSSPIGATPLDEQQAWRLANFGSINNAGDAADDADPDGDGATNQEEFNAGTDPNDLNSHFHISSAMLSGSDYVINFTSVSGKLYRLEWSASLQPGSWNVVQTNGMPQDNIAGTGGVIQVTDSSGAAQSRRFYRVVVE